MDGMANSCYKTAQEKAHALEQLNQDRRLTQEKERKNVFALDHEFYQLAERNQRMRAQLGRGGGDNVGKPNSKRPKLS